MAHPLDQLSRDWADARRKAEQEIREAIRNHRLRTAHHLSKTVREAHTDWARGLTVAWTALALILLAVAGAYLALLCGWEPLGC